MFSFPRSSLSKVYLPGASFITACFTWYPVQVIINTSGKKLAREFSFKIFPSIHGATYICTLKGSKTMMIPLLATSWGKEAGVQDGARAAVTRANTLAKTC